MTMTAASERTASLPDGAPEGVYQRDGKWWRDIKRLVRDGDGFAYERIPRQCAWAVSFDSEEEISRKREAAARTGQDFYDPRVVEGQVVGWLDRGRKRQQEWPANLGAGADRYEREPVPAEENPDIAAGLVPVAVGKDRTNGK